MGFITQQDKQRVSFIAVQIKSMVTLFSLDGVLSSEKQEKNITLDTFSPEMELYQGDYI